MRVERTLKNAFFFIVFEQKKEIKKDSILNRRAALLYYVQARTVRAARRFVRDSERQKPSYAPREAVIATTGFGKVRQSFLKQKRNGEPPRASIKAQFMT